MPVRSINLKLILSRNADNRSAAKDIWTTHAAVNKAVAEYESLLLEMRGKTYSLKEGDEVSLEDVTTRLDTRIKAACDRNGRRSVLSQTELTEIRILLRQLYEAIVPSSIGNDGNAQQANAFIGPLTDPESKGFLSVFDKIGEPPVWLEGVRNGEADAFVAATLWSESPEGKSRLAGTGSPPTWVRKFRKKETDWPVAFVADYDRKLTEAEGVPRIVRTLKDRKVLPLVPPFLTPLIADARGTLSPWDRLAFRLAVGHLLSWESWCLLAFKEHGIRQEKLRTFTTTYLDKPELSASLEAIRKYESDRHEELARIGFTPNTSFRIKRRMVRSWPELREKWLATKDKSPDRLMLISAEEQTRLRGKFGDPHLFQWLAQSENHSIWEQSTDVVSLISTANALVSLLERSRSQADMTLPDPLLHPRSVQWEPVGGSNLKNYRLSSSNGRIVVTIPLLRLQVDGTYVEINHSFTAAPHSQLRNVVLSPQGKGTSITFLNQSSETFSGTLNSADLLLDWAYLRHHKVTDVSSGNIGPAWFKLVIDVEQQLPDGWDGKRPQGVIHFTSAIGNNKRINDVRPGLRVLAVDLGVRSFGTCSVFTLLGSPPETGKLCYPVEGGLFAVHERSFVLKMPGEVQDAKGEAWRNSARDEVRALRRTLGRYRSYYRIAVATSLTERESLIAEQLTAVVEWQGWPFEEQLLSGLLNQVGLSTEQWETAVAAALDTFRRQFGEIVGEWRRTTRPRSAAKAMGKSIWAIEYLTDVRKFLTSWSLLGRKSGDVRRLDRTMRGVFASRLLSHLDGMKEDRLKTGADLIVQAARGFLRDETGAWKKKYSPCHAILFEDLTRYRMKTDRPKRENSQLMLWAHRSVPQEVAMQGEIYGICTADTGAAFSSRYHSSTGAPGIRCHPITASDKDNEFLRGFIEQENQGIIWDDLKPGDLVPLSGGELFACLGNGGTIRVHADINAAQNLHRRFWTRHADAFRLPCKRIIVNGDERWVPRTLSKRLFGALGGYGWLVPTGHDSGSCRWESITPRQWKSLGGEVRDDDQLSDELSIVEDVSEEMLESSGEVLVFFRDPSGIVFPDVFWYPGKIFWGVVKSRTAAAVLKH